MFQPMNLVTEYFDHALLNCVRLDREPVNLSKKGLCVTPLVPHLSTLRMYAGFSTFIFAENQIRHHFGIMFMRTQGGGFREGRVFICVFQITEMVPVTESSWLRQLDVCSGVPASSWDHCF
jgi:hypothetical protein